MCYLIWTRQNSNSFSVTRTVATITAGPSCGKISIKYPVFWSKIVSSFGYLEDGSSEILKVHLSQWLNRMQWRPLMDHCLRIPDPRPISCLFWPSGGPSTSSERATAKHWSWAISLGPWMAITATYWATDWRGNYYTYFYYHPKFITHRRYSAIFREPRHID